MFNILSQTWQSSSTSHSQKEKRWENLLDSNISKRLLYYHRTPLLKLSPHMFSFPSWSDKLVQLCTSKQTDSRTICSSLFATSHSSHGLVSVSGFTLSFLVGIQSCVFVLAHSLPVANQARKNTNFCSFSPYCWRTFFNLKILTLLLSLSCLSHCIGTHWVGEI